MNRESLYHMYLELYDKYSSDVEFYGSFVKGNFHYNDKLKISYSDLDCALKTHDISENVQGLHSCLKSFQEETGIVYSLREKRIHNESISKVQSYYISIIEFLYKTIKNKDENYIGYQAVKLAMRGICFNNYYEKTIAKDDLISSGFSAKVSDWMIQIKTGRILFSEYIHMGEFVESLREIDPFLFLFVRNGFDFKNNQVQALSLLNEKMCLFVDKVDLLQDLNRKVELKMSH